jgi:hypothetical protein
MEENRKAIAVVRTMQLAIQTERVRATRHLLHIKALRKYMLDKGLTSLNDTDCDNLLYAAGENAVLELPSDQELQVIKRKKGKKKWAKAKSAGLSTTTGPSTNRSRLSPESISSFEDSDHDFIPSDA